MPKESATPYRRALIEALRLLQDGYCRWCQTPLALDGAVELDHVVPLSQGGGWDIENLQAIHRHCHVEKSGLESGERNRQRAARRRLAHA